MRIFYFLKLLGSLVVLFISKFQLILLILAQTSLNGNPRGVFGDWLITRGEQAAETAN